MLALIARTGGRRAGRRPPVWAIMASLILVASAIELVRALLNTFSAYQQDYPPWRAPLLGVIGLLPLLASPLCGAWRDSETAC